MKLHISILYGVISSTTLALATTRQSARPFSLPREKKLARLQPQKSQLQARRK